MQTGASDKLSKPQFPLSNGGETEVIIPTSKTVERIKRDIWAAPPQSLSRTKHPVAALIILSRNPSPIIRKLGCFKFLTIINSTVLVFDPFSTFEITSFRQVPSRITGSDSTWVTELCHFWLALSNRYHQKYKHARSSYLLCKKPPHV